MTKVYMCIVMFLFIINFIGKANAASFKYYSEEYNTFHGYECTDDCSGHEAGYEWAKENDISDIENCDGNSDSFNEGCQVYVEENY
ncbi:MAG: hypothetical protein ABIE74_11205 [Pseudomonadota bacterium]